MSKSVYHRVELYLLGNPAYTLMAVDLARDLGLRVEQTRRAIRALKRDGRVRIEVDALGQERVRCPGGRKDGRQAL